MPLCTGNETQTDVWACPYCKPVKPQYCYTLQSNGYKAQCHTKACVKAGKHFATLAAYTKHLSEEHFT